MSVTDRGFCPKTGPPSFFKSNKKYGAIDMQIKISKYSVLYNAAQMAATGLILQILGFIYRIYLNQMVGVEGLGVYRLIFPVSSVLMAASIVGIKMAVTNISARYTLPGDRWEIHHLVRRCTYLFLGLFFTLAIPIGLFHKTIAIGILGDERTSYALVILLFAIFLAGFEGVFEALYLGIKKTKYTAISNLIEQVTQMGAVLLLLSWVGSSHLEITTAAMALGAVISEIPVVIWLVFIYRREIMRGTSPRLAPHSPRGGSGRMWVSILSVSVPVSATSIITNALASISTILLPKQLVLAGLSHKEALSALGIISGIAMPLIIFPLVFVSALSSVIMPVLSQSHAQNDKAAISRRMKKSFEATGLIAFGSTCALLPVVGALARILYQQELNSLYIGLLSLCGVLLYYQVVSVSVLNGLNRQRLSMISVILGESVQLFFTWWLCAMPEFTVFGYILAMIISCIVVISLNLYFIYQVTGTLPSFYRCFFIPAFLGLVMGLFSRFFYGYFTSVLSWEPGAILLALGLSFAIGIGVLPVIGLNPMRYIATLIPSSRVDEIPLKNRG